MQPKNVLPLVLFIPLFLAACTAAPQTRSGKPGKSETTQVVNDVPGDLKAGPNENIASYATKIKRSIEEKIYRPESYKGQECTLRILLARDGLVMSATAEIGRVAAGAVSGDVKTSAGRRDAISSINSVTRLMALAAVSLQARLQANPAMVSAVDTVTGLGASFGLL